MNRVLSCLLLAVLLPALLGACGELPTSEPAPTATPQPTAAPTTPPQPQGGTTVYDASEAFTLEYPAAWEVVEKSTANTVLFVAPKTAGGDPFRENVGVTRQALTDQATTVESYTAEFLAIAPDVIDGYQLVSSEVATLSGLPAQRVVYTGLQTGVPLQWLQVWTVTGDEAYILTYTAGPAQFESFLADADALIASFTLK